MVGADGENGRRKRWLLFAQLGRHKLQERLVVNSPIAVVVLRMGIFIQAGVMPHACQVHEHIKTHGAIFAAVEKTGGVAMIGQHCAQTQYFVALIYRFHERLVHERRQYGQN